MSVGRENAYILEDLGRSPPTVMGALVLASPRYYQPRRDEVLGWRPPSGLKTMSDAGRDLLCIAAIQPSWCGSALDIFSGEAANI